MTANRWIAFPYDAAGFGYAGAALEHAWGELHRGDCEPFPDADWVAFQLARHPRLKGRLEPAAAAAALQSAWRAYHRGDFAAAVNEGVALGPLGANAANKAANIYASYLETNEERKKEIFLQSVRRADALQTAAPDFANAYYLHAQALGRYSQEISVAKALALGYGGKVKASLDKALKLEPGHAEAHIAMGAYHAEIVAKVGAALARLTYGASKEEAMKHFDKARELLPHSAIARVEAANGLVLMFGKSKLDEARRLYAEAAREKPADAMQRLDAEHAREE